MKKIKPGRKRRWKNTARLSVSLDNSLKKQLFQTAKKQGLSVSDLCRPSLEELVK